MGSDGIDVLPEGWLVPGVCGAALCWSQLLRDRAVGTAATLVGMIEVVKPVRTHPHAATSTSSVNFLCRLGKQLPGICRMDPLHLTLRRSIC